ncbi:DUF1656 domain-containing protein [Vibrio sp.]|uniref:DUF1656 domain-containing protein n=1 Tax=Vibrio viridaestus TaxID=2487322 RepID=A0A3N9TH92_9VIBR|nr:DUF1656 domain-containing protein [Vibrio viridaestus]MDC0610700.1 DUF1656 domain-containing protein [Vibrio sp.]RQW63671.1 DUF1656 domain-containing protein [Vibrio viridaestus]
MFQEIAIGGLLFSPLVLFIPMALILSYLMRLVMYKTGLYSRFWKPAWIEVSLFVFILFFIIRILGV